MTVDSINQTYAVLLSDNVMKTKVLIFIRFRVVQHRIQSFLMSLDLLSLEIG